MINQCTSLMDAYSDIVISIRVNEKGRKVAISTNLIQSKSHVHIYYKSNDKPIADPYDTYVKLCLVPSYLLK